MPTFVRTQSIEHPIGEKGRFSLKITSGDVRLRGTDEAVARARATFEIRAASEEDANRLFEESQLRVGRGTSSVSIEEPDGRSSFGAALGRLLAGRGHVELSVEAEIPRLAELRAECVSADLQAEGLRGEQRYTTVSGDLYVTEAAGSLTVTTVSGDVTIRAVQAISLRAEAVSGDLMALAPRFDGLRAEAVSGDVELEGALGRGDLRIDTVSGDLTFGLLGGATFEVRGLSTDINSDLDHRIEGRLDRRRVVIGDGGPELIFNSMSGDLSIGRPRRIEAPLPDRDRAADEAPAAAAALAAAAPSAEDQLAVLQALERGEIDVDEAARRLAGGRTDG